jgi:hypothetical protein
MDIGQPGLNFKRRVMACLEQAGSNFGKAGNTHLLFFDEIVIYFLL